MTILTLTPQESALLDLNGDAIKFARRSVRRTDAGIITLSFILIVLQVLDGVLTAIGVSHFGPGIEANLLIRNLMHSIGYIPALLCVKGLGIAVVVTLCMIGSTVRWLNVALKAVIGIYICAAIIPWSVILLRHLA